MFLSPHNSLFTQYCLFRSLRKFLEIAETPHNAASVSVLYLYGKATSRKSATSWKCLVMHRQMRLTGMLKEFEIIISNDVN